MIPLLYLDNAATTYPKPKQVYNEIYNSMKEYGGSAGRGAYPLALSSVERLWQSRCDIARFFNFQNPENVVFTYNTTYALNIAVKALVKPYTNVLISNMEHNSVYRPVVELSKRGYCKYKIFNLFNTNAENVIKELKALSDAKTSAVICTAASNICNINVPLKEIGKFCKSENIIFICDAAQGAGHFPIDMTDCNISALCAPAHKGLYGPQGLGFVIFSSDADCFKTVIEGGNGYNSMADDMGASLPERFEAGTQSAFLTSGISKGIEFLGGIGWDNIEKHEKSLWKSATDMLSFSDRIEAKGNSCPGPVISFTIDGIDSEKVGEMLANDGICVRCGLHCAPLAHRTLGTAETGTVRISFGMFNTEEHIKTLSKSLLKILNSALPDKR